VKCESSVRVALEPAGRALLVWIEHLHHDHAWYEEFTCCQVSSDAEREFTDEIGSKGTHEAIDTSLNRALGTFAWRKYDELCAYIGVSLKRGSDSREIYGRNK
jgi:hypothetical protein